MTATISWDESFEVGKSLFINTAKLGQQPFDGATVDKFQEDFAAQEEKHNFEPGEYKTNSTLAMSSKEKNSALDIKAKLSVSYGPVSADASVEYARHNAASSLDVTFIYNASSEGSVLKGKSTGLKLMKSLEGIQEKGIKLEAFKKSFGDHVIIGKTYGGQVIIAKQYSCSTQSSKERVGAALKASYGSAGFGIKADVKVDVNNSTQTQDVQVKDQKLFLGCDAGSEYALKITEAVNSIGGDDKTNYAAIVDENAQKLLNQGKLKPKDAVIVPIESIQCISEAFVMEILINGGGPPEITKYPRLNATYFAVIDIKKDVDAMNESLEELMRDENNAELHEAAKAMKKDVGKWQAKLGDIKLSMEEADSATLKEWKGDEQKTAADDTAELDKPIPNINGDVLSNEFFDNIEIKYNALMAKAQPSIEPTKISVDDLKLTAQYYDAKVLLTDDVVTCGRDVSSIVAQITWVDQDWGNLKGQVYLRILRFKEGVTVDYSMFGVAEHAEKSQIVKFPSEQFPVDKYPLPKKGDIVSFVRYIGGGGGHELNIKTFEATISY